MGELSLSKVEEILIFTIDNCGGVDYHEGRDLFVGFAWSGLLGSTSSCSLSSLVAQNTGSGKFYYLENGQRIKFPREKLHPRGSLFFNFVFIAFVLSLFLLPT